MDPREGEVNEITGKECKYTANGKWRQSQELYNDII
jgi:hypothetical protein